MAPATHPIPAAAEGSVGRLTACVAAVCEGLDSGQAEGDLRLAMRLNSAGHTATCWVDFALTPEDAVLMDCQEIWFSVG
ncbi:unnamed protein product [Arctogadus glacialis]